MYWFLLLCWNSPDGSVCKQLPVADATECYASTDGLRKIAELKAIDVKIDCHNSKEFI